MKTTKILVLKYVSINKLQEIFTLEEFKDIFSNKTITPPIK